MKNLLTSLTIIILQLSIINSAFAQNIYQFTPVKNGDVAWGDYNNDGNLDVLLAGESETGKITKIYKNNGNETFTEQTDIVLPGFSDCAIAWSDYNNDGFLDFYISGITDTDTTVILYKNNGNNSFTAQSINFSIETPYNSTIKCFDCDNDGNEDVLIGSSYDYSTLFKNNGDETFTVQQEFGRASGRSSIDMGDYNNDNWIDLIIKCHLYKNTGDGTFSLQNEYGYLHQSLFLDYNKDNYLDFAVSKNISGKRYLVIYSNNKNETFSVIDTIQNVIFSNVTLAIIDYNNDNYPDLIFSGDSTSGNGFTKIFKNNRDSTFSDSQSDLPPISNPAIACGDYNNDNNTDFILLGSYAGDYFTRLYTNTGNNDFCFPEISEFENFSTFDEIQAVSWSSALWADYDNDGFQDFIISGHTDYSINQIDPVTKLYKNNENGTFSENTLTDFPGVGYSAIAWGDYNNDTYQDILLTGYDNENFIFISKIYKNNGDGSFTEQTQIELTGVDCGSVAWGDYNNDSYSDILLTGYSSENIISKVYKNNGNETFTEQTQIELTGVGLSSVAWGDYNKDNYLDILLTGNSDAGKISKIYKNNGNETFTEQTGINLAGVRFSSATWADYNNDGFLDVLISGQSEDEYYGITELYKNNGNETFTKQSDNFPDLIFASNKWFDFDNDGNLDVLLTGQDDDGLISKIFKNNGNGIFTEQTQINLQGVDVGSVDCADYNNDGFEDILLTGEILPASGLMPFSSIYANNGKGNFEKVDYTFPVVRHSFISTADFNKDGNTDMLIFGQNADSEQITELYKTTAFGFQKTDIVIPVLKDGTSSWGDYNNNGYLDLIICGKNNLGIPTTKLLKNSTNGKFMETGIFISGVYNGYTEWADYNNDGLLDFVIAGNTGSSLITKIYKNTGNNFVETSAILPGSNHAIWADYNNDGLWDILLTDNNNTTRVFKNTGNDNFTETFNYPDVHYLMQDIKFSDYDYDGFDDIVMLKEYNYTINKAEIMFFKNTGNGTFAVPKEFFFGGVNFNSTNYLSVKDFNFDGKPDLLINNSIKNGYNFISVYSNDTSTLETPTLISGTVAGSVAWADFDNDNDFDFFTCGKFNNDTIAKVFYNNGDVHNTVPNSPAGLDFSCNNDTVFLSWNKATDNETPQNTLTYNCYMYEIGGDTIWHSMSDKNTGKRYLQRPGNAGHNTSWFITGLDVTKEYAWSVQAIDNSFLGGEFATENTFRLAPAFVIQPIDQTVCETGSITFNTSTTPADEYQWYQFAETDTVIIENNEYYSNATSPNLTISNAILDMHDYELHCAATTVGGTTYSQPAILSVDTLILANADSDAIVCTFSEYQLQANSAQNETGFWSCDIEQVQFEDIYDPNTIVTNFPQGNTSVSWTIVQDNVCGSNSDIMVISFDPDSDVPYKLTAPTGDNFACKGGISTFSTSGNLESDEYLWSLFPESSGTSAPDGNNNIINWFPDFNDFAYIKVKGINHCGEGDWSDSLQVIINSPNASEIIQKSENMLVSVDSGYAYQWYLNGSAVNGANKQYYYNENMATGDYSIEITDKNECKALSGIYTFGNVNKSLPLSETIQIYPNPTTGNITIEIDNELLCKVKYTINDNLGRKRKESIINKKQTFIKFDEDLSGLNTGNYHIEFIFNEKEKVSKQLIIK